MKLGGAICALLLALGGTQAKGPSIINGNTQGNVSGGVIGWFKDITGQTAKEQLVQVQAKLVEANAKVEWTEQRNTKLTELYLEKIEGYETAMEVKDAALVKSQDETRVATQALMATAFLLFQAQKDIAQESNEHNMCRLDADQSAAAVVEMTADLAIANSIIEDFRDVTLDVLDAVTTIEHIAVEGVQEVEAICYLGLNATVAYAEMQITANVDAAAVARQVLIDSFNSTNSALQSQVSAQPSEVQALAVTVAALAKQIAGLTLVNEVYWIITEALRILATLLAFCAAAYVCGRVCALLGKCWQRAVAAVKSVLSVTEKSVTAGDAPEDATEASQSRRSTATFGEATRGAERRATTPLYDNKAAGAGTITLGDASTASAASGTGTTMGTLLQVRVFIGLVDVFKWFLSCFGLMCAADAQRETEMAVAAAEARAELAVRRADVAVNNVRRVTSAKLCKLRGSTVKARRTMGRAVASMHAAELERDSAVAVKNGVLLDTSAELMIAGFAICTAEFLKDETVLALRQCNDSVEELVQQVESYSAEIVMWRAAAATDQARALAEAAAESEAAGAEGFSDDESSSDDSADEA